MPLILSAPESWKLKPADQPTYLEGPAPDGDIQISLSLLEAMSENGRRLYIKGALDESQKHPGRILIRQSTGANGMQMLERITYSDLPEVPAGHAAAATEPSAPLAWSIVMFVPYQDKFISCRFDVFKLTQQEYTDDQQFVETLIGAARPGNFAAFR
jgi:hypothetical protein